MVTTFRIELPKGSSRVESKAIAADLRQLGDIEDAGTMEARSIDPQQVALWVQASSTALGAIGTAVPVIQNVVGLIRGKGIKGARIILPNGIEFAADEVSAKDLQTLLKGLTGK